MPYLIVSHLCSDSRLCIRECPMEAISLNDKTGKAVIDPDLCTDCGTCADICPEGAITGLTDESEDRN